MATSRLGRQVWVAGPVDKLLDFGLVAESHHRGAAGNLIGHLGLKPWLKSPSGVGNLSFRE